MFLLLLLEGFLRRREYWGIYTVYISAIVIVFALLTMSTVTASVFATGIRGDSDEDATAEESRCWVNGYDSGFAGKYDKDKLVNV